LANTGSPKGTCIFTSKDKGIESQLRVLAVFTPQKKFVGRGAQNAGGRKHRPEWPDVIGTNRRHSFFENGRQVYNWSDTEYSRHPTWSWLQPMAGTREHGYELPSPKKRKKLTFPLLARLWILNGAREKNLTPGKRSAP